MQSWRGNQQLYARVERLVRQSSGRTKGAEPPSGRDATMAASSEGAGGEDGGGEPMGSQESRPLGDELDKAADGDGPGALSRAAYARKVFVASKTGYLTKKSGTAQGGAKNGGIGKIKFMNYVSKKRFFVLTGESLMYHHDHKNLDDPLNSKEIILDENSVISFSNEPSLGFAIELIADGKMTHLGAKDEVERREWKEAIQGSIGKLKGSTRGYLMKLRAGTPTPASAPMHQAPLGAAVTSGDFKHVPQHHVPDTLLEGKDGAGEWCRKYFIVDGGHLTFHASHSSTLIVQGEFALPHTSQVEVRPGLLVVIRNDSDTMVCMADKEADVTRWVDAINGAIKENAHKRQLVIEARAARGEDPLASTFDLQNFVTSVTASVSENSSNGGLGNDGGDAGLKTPRQGVTEGDAVRSPGGGFESRPHGRSLSGGEREVGGGALLKGDLATRPKSGDGPWRAAHYVLEKGRLLVFVDRHHIKPKQVHKISPSCSVFETNLKAFSFEVVVAGLVLHLQGSSFEDSLRWIATLKAAINNSPPDETDPLLSEALRLEDTFYYADFETKQPLGVVLERSKEWAIVKLANPELSQVSVGSALSSVNGESVVLKAYEETIAMLTGWKPPLNLIFRRAPVKEGWLKKAGVGKKASKWKNVWVDLREGKLSWFKLGPGGTLLGAMPMIGSAVALDPETESGASNCLSVVAGVMSVVLQALNRQDALSWASHLYQASAVANGGGYLLDQERDQEVAYEEERRRRLAQEALERERFARSKRNSPQRPRSQAEEEQKEEGQPQQPQQQEGEDGQPSADGALVPAAGSDDVVLEDKAAVAAAAGGPAEAETATATVSAESAAAGPLGFSTTDPTAAAAAAAAPAVDDAAAAAAAAARDSDEQQRSLDGENPDEVVVVAPDAAASAGDDGGDGSEKDDADEFPFSPTAAAAAAAGRPELTVEVGDVVNGGTSAAAAAASGGAAAALSAPSEESTIGDLSGGRRPSGSVGGRPTFERKSSSVMDLIREREKAAQSARLPPSARKETSTTHSPSLAAALTRGKVGAKPWLGASDSDNTPAAAAAAAASTPRWGSSMFSSSSPKASAAAAAVSGFSTAPAVAPTGGDDATAGEEEEQDKVASLAAAEASAGAGGGGGGEKAMSPSMAAARMRKTVDRSMWSSAPSSSGAGSGPGLSATWAFNSAAGKQQKSSDESAQEGGPAEETEDGASGAPPAAVADCPPPAGFAAAKAMFASTGGIRSNSRPTATSAVAAADVLAAAKAERESSAAAAAAAAGAVSSSSSSSVRQEVVVPASPAGFAAAKALFASTGGIPSGSKASLPPPSKPRTSTGAAAAAYARAAATSNSTSAPAPREPAPRATTKPWEKKTATAGGGGGGGGGATGASWGSAATSASAAAVTTTDSSSISSDDDGEPSSSAGGGRSLSPVTTPGAGGAAAKGSTSRHHQKSSEPRASPAVAAAAAAAEPSLSSSSVFGSTGGSVKAMSRDIFGSSSSGFKRPPTGGVALAGFGLTAPAAPRQVPEVAAPPLESRPIGGPWDEEEVLKWVRDVTKLDIDPECGVAYSLKDGVALCRLMSKLQPGAPITAPSDSSLAYKQMANICIFLRSCRTLGLGESILFETADLYEEKDIPNVVKTLVALGEHVPRSCPAFKGPHLNMSKFAWSTVLAQPSSTGGGGSGKTSSLRASTGGISGRGGGGVSGSWPRRGGSSGGNGNVGAVWRRAVGSDHPASSGDEGSSEDDDDDDDDFDSDEEDEEYDDEDEAVGSGSSSSAAAAANGGSRAAAATGGGARDGELTDEMLSKAYDSVEAASQSGGLSPIQFSSLWRSLSGDRQNLFAEMKMFHKFNTSGDSVVNFEEFKAGFRLIAQENAKEHEQVLKNLKDWTDSQPAAF